MNATATITRPADAIDFQNAREHIERMTEAGKPKAVLDRLQAEYTLMKQTGIFTLR